LSTIFDTHQYVKRMKQAGFTEEQAEVQATALAELIETKLATKQDLVKLKDELTIRIGAMLAGAVGILTALEAWIK